MSNLIFLFDFLLRKGKKMGNFLLAGSFTSPQQEDVTLSGLNSEVKNQMLNEALIAGKDTDPYKPWEAKDLGGSNGSGEKVLGIPIVKDRLVRALVSGKSLEKAIDSLDIQEAQWMLATWPEFGSSLRIDDLTRVVAALRRKGCVCVMICAVERTEGSIDTFEQLLKQHGILPLICVEISSWKLIKEGKTDRRIAVRGIEDLLRGELRPFSSLVCQVLIGEGLHCLMGIHSITSSEIPWFKAGSIAKVKSPT